MAFVTVRHPLRPYGPDSPHSAAAGAGTESTWPGLYVDLQAPVSVLWGLWRLASRACAGARVGVQALKCYVHQHHTHGWLVVVALLLVVHPLRPYGPDGPHAAAAGGGAKTARAGLYVDLQAPVSFRVLGVASGQASGRQGFIVFVFWVVSFVAAVL
jgi:hypothetical protein